MSAKTLEIVTEYDMSGSYDNVVNIMQHNIYPRLIIPGISWRSVVGVDGTINGAVLVYGTNLEHADANDYTLLGTVSITTASNTLNKSHINITVPFKYIRFVLSKTALTAGNLYIDLTIHGEI